MGARGDVAEWLGRGLQSLVHQFESGRRLSGDRVGRTRVGSHVGDLRSTAAADCGSTVPPLRSINALSKNNGGRSRRDWAGVGHRRGSRRGGKVEHGHVVRRCGSLEQGQDPHRPSCHRPRTGRWCVLRSVEQWIPHIPRSRCRLSGPATVHNCDLGPLPISVRLSRESLQRPHGLCKRARPGVPGRG